jgi:outer membrane murein-binding lipoprotein Lpp
MYKALVTIWLAFSFLSGYGQANIDMLYKQKDSVLRLYSFHTDSITENTWLNVMKSNSYLKQLIHLDSMIIQQNSGVTQDSLIQDFKNKIKSFDTLVHNSNLELSQLRHDYNFYKRMYFMLLIIGILFLLIILVLLVLTGRLNRLSRDKEKQLKTYHTDLFSAREEIEEARKTENQMASEINKLKKELAERYEGNADAEKLKEEKLMLENQIIEVKKAYELESAKRMELESELMQQDKLGEDVSGTVDQEKFEQLSQLNEALQAEQKEYEHKIEEFGKQIEALKKENNIQAEAREKAEKQHAELIVRLKNLSEGL